MKKNYKVFYWLFGIFLAGILYYLINNLSFFSHVKEIWYLKFILPLVVIFLFYFIGNFISKIPKASFLFLKKKDKVSFTDVEYYINLEDNEKELKETLSTIKKLIRYVVKEKYSEESLKVFIDYFNLKPEVADDIFGQIKKLKLIKTIYWIFGLILSISSYFLIISLPRFYFLRFTIYPFLIALTIFILFIVEGYLIIRLPQTFYLRLFNLKNLNEINYQREQIYKNTKKQEKHKDNIKKTIKYLLKIKTDFNFVKQVLIDGGFSEEVAKNILVSIIKEAEDEGDIENKLPVEKNENIIKLFLSKINTELSNLKNINNQINEINKKIKVLEEKMVEEEKEKKVSKKEKEAKKEKETKKPSVDKKSETKKEKKERNKLKQKMPKIDQETGIGIDDKKKQENYKKQINFLFEFLKPYAKKYTKDQLEALLVSQEYKLSIISDVLEKFKEEGVGFLEKEKIQTKAINFINNLYFKISKKKE